jgi:hypothetical protein
LKRLDPAKRRESKEIQAFFLCFSLPGLGRALQDFEEFGSNLETPDLLHNIHDK